MIPSVFRRFLFTQVPSILLCSSFTEAFALRNNPSIVSRGGAHFSTTMNEEKFLVDDFIAAASAAADERAAQEARATSAASARKNPIDVFGIDHVVLLVDDLEGMSNWYQRVLGCRVAKHNQEFQMMHLDAGSALIDLVDNAGPLGNGGSSSPEHPNMDHLCLGLVNFDEAAIREHLAANGVPITTEVGLRYGKNGYGESLYFQDPEGNRIEIKQSKAMCLP